MRLLSIHCGEVRVAIPLCLFQVEKLSYKLAILKSLNPSERFHALPMVQPFVETDSCLHCNQEGEFPGIFGR